MEKNIQIRPDIHKNTFYAIAIGITLALLPSAVGLLFFIGRSWLGKDTLNIGFIFQALGALVILGAFWYLYRQINESKIEDKAILLGLKIAMIASFIGFAANFGFVVGEGATYSLSFHGQGKKLTAVLGGITFVSLSPLMAVATYKLSKIYTRFKPLWISFTVLSFVIFAESILWQVFKHNSPNVYDLRYINVNLLDNYYHQRIMDQGLVTVSHLVFGLALIVTISSAWYIVKSKRAVKKHSRYDETRENYPNIEIKSETDHSRYMPKETVVEEARNSRPAIEIKSDEIKSETDHSRFMPKDTAVVEEPKRGLNDAVVTMLMGYDNDRLKEIVEKPGYYNPEVVTKAGQLLCRRLAWEQIKDLTDKELLNMSKGPAGMYDENIVEAASMELYQRGSKLLFEEFMLMSPDTVSDIANDRTPAPEGVQLAARQFLSKNFRL